MATTAGPTVVRRQLARTLKRIRADAGVSVDHVVANRELGISRAKLYRLEAGQHPVKPQDVVVLCQYFGVPAEEIKRLTALALATQDRSDAAIPEWFQLYRDLEQVASTIRLYEAEVIPGEVQTGAYARAVFRAAKPGEDEESIGHQVALRLERQERLLNRSPAPQLSLILGEAAFVRRVGGGEALMEAQRAHLRAIDQRDNVDIWVLPFSVGAHAAMTGAFRVADFADPDDPDIVYLEAHIGGRYLQKPEEHAEYRRIWDLIHRTAIPLKEFSP